MMRRKERSVKYILGIEGSANKLGISIINNEMKILVNMRRTFVSETGCGFIPREINAHHRHFIIEMLEECLKKVNINIKDIDLICYTKGPGIGSALYIGYNLCKILHLLHGIPTVGVNHCIAHIEMGIFITKLANPIVLYVSGSNTQIIYFNPHKKRYEIIGETLDIAIGNIIDRSARILKISNAPSPGYNVELLARKKKLLNKLKKKQKKNHIECKDPVDYTELLIFPYTVKGMDISFSGYDFYIHKYFSKYAKKSKQIEKSDSKNKEKFERRKNRRKQKECNNTKKDEPVETSVEKEYKENEYEKNQEEGEIKNNAIDSSINNNNDSSSNTNSNINKNMDDIPEINGKSYYEDNIIYKSENKKNFGESEEDLDEHCSIETDSDFFDISSDNETDTTSRMTTERNEPEEQEILNLTEEEKRKIQICYSLQHHIFSMLIEITERAISFTSSKEVIIVGGVGCNVFLQNMMKKMAKQKGIKIGFMDHSYCVDNGAMIAYTGYLEYLHSNKREEFNFENITVQQRYRTDDVTVTWR